MKYINFVDFDIEKEDIKTVQNIFDQIKNELEYHKFSYNTYPKKIFIYKHYINFMADKTPVTKNNMIIAI